MYLKKIQLAGFKSFVDPTTVLLQSNRTAIVGPNGCGKSNIVDALRWVIGESSAKQLRGELLTDVIFNGTTHRKPVGQASIELLFDNAEGRMGGAYAQYNEISIRREINRDGHSQFYLNGSRCRRRDITDLFLGTGLGPHSYAIIEQGVVSKLIESKPEELRVYLEEAAGISKYRERRRETENRIRGTRENLERLTDVRQEIEKQLEHLKRQANAAERFKVLKQEQRLLKAQLHALHCQSLDAHLAEQQQVLETQSATLETQTATQQQVNQDIEQLREQHNTSNTALNDIQAEYYAHGADIARQEQQIAHIQQQERQLAADLAHIENAWKDAEHHMKEDNTQIATLSTELGTIEPKIAETAQAAIAAQQDVQQRDQLKAEWQTEWDQFQAQATAAEQKVQLENTRLQHSQQKIQGLEQRIQRLEAQCQQWNAAELPTEIQTLTEQSTALKEQLDNLQNSINTLNAQIQEQRASHQQQQTERDSLRQNLHQLSSRQASLEALQQAALGKTNPHLNSWLTQRQWETKPRLLEGLTVDAGWETAVETVLAPYLEAVCTDSAEDLSIAAREFTTGRLAIVLAANKATQVSTQPGKESLAQKVQSQLPIAGLLAGIYIADDVTQALSLLDTLEPQESVITREGVWFGPSWVRVSKVQDETSGMLQRKQALEELNVTVSAQQTQLQAVEQQLSANQQQLSQGEEARDSKQREFREISNKYNELYSRLSARQAHFEQLRKQEATALQELQEQREQLTQATAQRDASQATKTQAEAERETFSTQRSQLLQRRDTLNQTQQALQQQAHAAKQAADACQMRQTSIQNQLHYLGQNIERTEKQLAQLEERRTALLSRRNEAQVPLPELQTALAEAQTQQKTVGERLQTAKEHLQQLEQQLREMEKLRNQTEQEAQVLRDQLAQIRIDLSTTSARRENHLAQILEVEHASRAELPLEPLTSPLGTFFAEHAVTPYLRNLLAVPALILQHLQLSLAHAEQNRAQQAVVQTLEILLQEMPEEANTTDWQQRLEQIETRIHRLGAINLAAIDEYNTLLERSTYLEEQNKDLCEALDTLEEAIRKIDRESRTRLRETFERANTNFKALFHKVFEGGNATLEWTGDEVLDAGVLIRAQPPGKRNTMLHLLSGGEKALTAIALVFALFQLNPAPFCVLDEVDAPLDEANVGRFSRLVQTMSDTVQFLFISHNKVTMEMAQQLVGVTMHEPGVSRLVSVDIDAAIAMATAS